MRAAWQSDATPPGCVYIGGYNLCAAALRPPLALQSLRRSTNTTTSAPSVDTLMQRANCTVKPRLQLGRIVPAAWPAAGPAPTPAAPPPLRPPPPPPSATVLVRGTINARIDGVGKYQSCMVFCCVVFYLVAIPALGCPSGRAPPPALGRRWQWRARVAAAPANPTPQQTTEAFLRIDANMIATRAIHVL